jgi:hypothetical protein
LREIIEKFNEPFELRIKQSEGLIASIKKEVKEKLLRQILRNLTRRDTAA